MRISKLEPSRHKKGRWLVWLDSGELLRVGEGEVADFALRAGMELEEGTLTALREAVLRGEAWRRALELLSARPLSRQELVDKLTARQCPAERAAAIAERLTELGYLDDQAYAAAVVRHYAGRGYGPYKIREELFRRGVPREYWQAAMEQREDQEAVLDALVAQKLRGVTEPDRKSLKKVSDALARRGYAWEDISAALRRYGARAEEPF